MSGKGMYHSTLTSGANRCKLGTGSRKKVINKCTKDKNRNWALSSKK